MQRTEDQQQVGTWNEAAAAHVLRRVGFGADRDAVLAATEAGLEATLADLEGRRTHDPDLTRGIERLLSLENLVQLQAWWMALILSDRAPLVERVTLMWHGHFATSNGKVGDVRLMHRQNQLFRENGLGDFRELMHAVAKDAAMLVWLDGNQNKVGQPNENFAREVMELFGLGIGGGYTESDVQEAARAFSGWGVDRRRFVFRAKDHDRGEKKLFGRAGVQTGEDAIERVLAHPACARWIARRLLGSFVLPDPPEALVASWAKALVDEEWHVGRTLARLFRDPLFLSREARLSRLAGPVELVARIDLTLRIHEPPVAAMRSAGTMGQSLFLPPTVKGWDGGRSWIDPGTWLARHNRISDLVLGNKGFDAQHAFGRGIERDAVVDTVARVLLPDGIDGDMRAVLEDAATNAGSTERALRDVTALVLTSPEFHLI